MKVSACLRVLFYSLLPGLVLFFIDQVWTTANRGEAVLTGVLAAYLSVFMVIALFGIAVTGLLSLKKDESFPPLVLIYTGAAYCFLLAVLRVDTTIRFFVENTCLVIFVMAFLWLRKDVLRGPRRLFIMAALIVILISWAIICPEEEVFAEPYCYFASAVFLGLMVGLIYMLRLGLKGSNKAELAAAALLLAAIFIIGLVWGISPEGDGGKSVKAWQGSPAREGNRPDIIFIVWDTVRLDRLSVYGYERRTTPYLEDRASDSMLYTRAVSVSPWTLASHASMFTGLYPRTHGARRFYRPEMKSSSRDYLDLPVKLTTLAEILTDRGYRCGGVSANYGYVGRRVNMDQGFEYFCDHENAQYLKERLFKLVYVVYKSVYPHMPPRYYFPYMHRHMNAYQVSARALRWLDSIERDRPFFLFLNYIDAHWRYHPPGEYVYLFPGFNADEAERGNDDIWLELMKQGRSISGRERGHLDSQYDACIAYLDDQLRLFEEGLKRRGIFENAFIVLVSDHGEFLGEHDLLGHGKDVYAEVLEIPLILRYPGGRPAGVESSLVENRALFDMVLAQAGVSVPAHKNPDTAIAEIYPRYPYLEDIEIVQYRRTRRAVFFGGLKFISSSDGADELYDLESDPRESSNLVGILPERAREGRELIGRFLESAPEGVELRDGKIRRHTPEELDMLRDLGYVH